MLLALLNITLIVMLDVSYSHYMFYIYIYAQCIPYLHIYRARRWCTSHDVRHDITGHPVHIASWLVIYVHFGSMLAIDVHYN